MRCVAFVSLALALAVSAMPVGTRDELHPDAPSLPLPGLPIPKLPVPNLPLPPRGLDLPGNGVATGEAGKLVGSVKGAASGATNTVESNPALKGVAVDGVPGTAGNVKGATNGLTSGTGGVTRRDGLPDPKKVLAEGQQTAQQVKGQVSDVTGVASKAVGSTGPVGARDTGSLPVKLPVNLPVNAPGAGGLGGQVGNTLMGAAGQAGGVGGSLPSPP